MVWVGLSPVPATAALREQTPTGFISSHTVVVPGTPDAAYARFIAIGDWWDGAHTYGGDARALRLTTRPGGCWCERLARGGFVEHMRVITAQPGELLRLEGGLGPLQALAVTGVMSVSFNAVPAGTEVVVDYIVRGPPPAGLEAMAGPVDRVLAAAVGRYAVTLD